MGGEKEKEPAREKERWKEKDKQKAQTRRKERRGKGRGQPKAKGRKRKTISFLCFCSRRFPCHALGPFNYSICSFSYGLLAGCLHKGPRCHFWVPVGIGTSFNLCPPLISGLINYPNKAIVSTSCPCHFLHFLSIPSHFLFIPFRSFHFPFMSS